MRALILGLCGCCVLIACDAVARLGRYVDDGGSSSAASDAAEPAPDAAERPLTEADQMFCDERGGGPGCGYCLGDACCREILRCEQDALCSCFLDCTRDAPLAECEATCGRVGAAFADFATCNDTRCAPACGEL